MKLDQHSPQYNRRAVTLALGVIPIIVACKQLRPNPEVRSLELGIGGEIGFVCKNLTTGALINYNGDKRFAMCSTFKWVLAAVILHQVDQGHMSLNQHVPYTKRDMVPYTPVTTLNLAKGSMTIGELCSAAVSLSDNTAANLLLRLTNGPSGFTEALRGFGDEVSRLDRWEVELNENLPGDIRDTTTAKAMVDLMARLLFKDGAFEPQILSPESRLTLRRWMSESETGMSRLRAGIPDTWQVGDKTGTSGNGAFNNVAFAISPGKGEVLLMASYVNAPNASMRKANAVHAALAEIAIVELG